MRVIIVGCGRVGARVAAELDQRGEQITVIDTSARAFTRLPQTFGGETVRGSGLDEDTLRSAGAEQADLVMALTEGDNRNALSAQLAKHIFGVPRVIAKINDPLRGEAYRALGLETICRTIILGDALVTAAIEGAAATNGFVEEPTAQPLRGAPPPGSPAGADARAALAAEDEEVVPEATIVQPSDGREGGF
ncbi:MAG TPA: TrkA family potassium uptake protein [Candidatus Limnocylindria bacterium]|jgi:trk system potassium uptake protein TrkA